MSYPVEQCNKGESAPELELALVLCDLGVLDRFISGGSPGMAGCDAPLWRGSLRLRFFEGRLLFPFVSQKNSCLGKRMAIYAIGFINRALAGGQMGVL